MDGEVPESCKASFHTPSLGLMAMFGDEDDADDNIENSEDCDICLIFPQTTVLGPKCFFNRIKNILPDKPFASHYPQVSRGPGCNCI